MGLPAKKSTRRAKGYRTAHLALAKIQYSACSKCKKPTLPHHVCTFCGTYNEKEVIKIKTRAKKGKKKTKEEKKKKTKEKSSK